MARTAEAAGADALVVAEAQADAWNPNAIRASTGAVFTLPVVESIARRGARRCGVQIVAAVRRRADERTPTPTSRARPRSSSAPRTRASTSGWRAAADVERLDPAARANRRQPQRRHRRGDPALRGGAPAWLSRDDVLRARADDRRPPAAHADASRRARSGARLKCELFQRTGSFKSRGALNKLSSLTREERRRGVIAISAGNHAQAVAFAAAEEGVDALLVMWQGASELKIAATRGYGATVDLEATDPAEAFDRLAELLRGDRPRARPPARRPARRRRRGHGRARDRGGRARRRRRHRRRSAAAA